MLRYSSPPQTYDPSRLFDVLLRRLRLTSDEMLCHVLGIAPFLLARIRKNDYPVVPELLLRINEVSGINVRELRCIMGDRRSEFRIGDAGMTQRRAGETSCTAASAQEKLIEAGDSSLPNRA